MYEIGNLKRLTDLGKLAPEAMAGFRALAIELATDSIRVNAIAPGVVETPLFDPLLTSEELASFNGFHPLGRNGQARDITAALLFLADDAASGWITGVVLPVDGGVMAGRNA